MPSAGAAQQALQKVFAYISGRGAGEGAATCDGGDRVDRVPGGGALLADLAGHNSGLFPELALMNPALERFLQEKEKPEPKPELIQPYP